MIAKKQIQFGTALCSAFILFISVLTSCSREELEIKQNFDYEVSVQKHRTDVEVNQEVRLVFFIKSNGNYENVQYSAYFFLRQGSGQIYDQKDRPILDNIQYRIKGDTLQITYIPSTQGDHTIEIEFVDLFGKRKEMVIKLRAD